MNSHGNARLDNFITKSKNKGETKGRGWLHSGRQTEGEVALCPARWGTGVGQRDGAARHTPELGVLPLRWKGRGEGTHSVPSRKWQSHHTSSRTVLRSEGSA